MRVGNLLYIGLLFRPDMVAASEGDSLTLLAAKRKEAPRRAQLHSTTKEPAELLGWA